MQSHLFQPVKMGFLCYIQGVLLLRIDLRAYIILILIWQSRLCFMEKVLGIWELFGLKITGAQNYHHVRNCPFHFQCSAKRKLV